ncbi:MAG: hypothetical protein A2Y53_05040 [Chloroflexi bacterium RBG_16_47_49]|nr:MAG: hypothetical protein A2Y53_05040 [Chloroflexi bacterium RBG_16_47_49]
MNNQITSREYELISSYLDNQLGSKERALLEARLKADPELRKELHEISKTRLLLRSLPRLRAPRNYYLNSKVIEKTVGVRPAPRFAPAFGIVSAIATILLALVIFGDRLLIDTTPVALAPDPVVLNETGLVQPEAERSVASTPSPTQEAPMAMMVAPAFSPTAVPTTAFKAGQSESATPTTIYLYAYPPTSIPGGMGSIFSEQTGTATVNCEEYLRSEAYPTLPYAYYCATPTNTPFGYLQSILPTSTTTPSPSPTPTPTTTATPTATPSFTPSPTPTPSDTPSSIMEVAPSIEEEVPLLTGPSDQVMDAGIATPSGEVPVESSGTTPNIDFVRYLVLAIEISLASIAIIAGTAAIILRIRAGR